MARTSTIAVLLRDFSLGGRDRTAIRLANAWAELGHRAILYVGDDRGPQKGLVRDGVEVETPRKILAGDDVLTDRLGAWFGEGCGRHGANAAFLPGNAYFRHAAAIAARTGGKVPVFAKFSSRMRRQDWSPARNLAFAAITHLRLKQARGLIAMSDALAQEARRAIGLGERIRVVADPIFEELPVPDPIGPRPWRICAVGRLAPEKNFQLLLESFARLTDLPVTLAIAGDGELRQALETRARALGIADRVEFLGAVDDAHACLAQSEVMMLTSEYEGYPAVIIEAFAAGAFVVARHCSDAIPEMLDTPGLGTIVEGRDPGAFAHAVRQYFAHRNRDLDLMARRAARHLSLEAAGRYLEVFGLA